MTYTDQEILDLIEDLRPVGLTETPNEELKRLLREWEEEAGVKGIRRKSPEEIAEIQKILFVHPDGIYGIRTHLAFVGWATQAFFKWMRGKGKEVKILEVGRMLSNSDYMVFYKDYAADFRDRSVLPSSEEDLVEAKFLYYNITDELPSALELWW